MLHRDGDHGQGNGHGSSTALLNRLDAEEAALWQTGEPAEMEVGAYLGPRTAFKGILRFKGTLRIDGKVEGEIHTDGVLLIGKDAVIRAKINARSIVSCGKITGDVIATDKIKLLVPAALKGSVRTSWLLMEEGVLFNGSLEMIQASEAPLHHPEADNEVPAFHRMPAISAAVGAN